MSKSTREPGMSTYLGVGEKLTFRRRHGTGVLEFSIDAKEVDQFLPDGSVDTAKITLTISRADGQRAKLRIHADDKTLIVRPKKAETLTT
jgi:hypothetical protein